MIKLRRILTVYSGSEKAQWLATREAQRNGS